MCQSTGWKAAIPLGMFPRPSLSSWTKPTKAVCCPHMAASEPRAESQKQHSCSATQLRPSFQQQGYFVQAPSCLQRPCRHLLIHKIWKRERIFKITLHNRVSCLSQGVFWDIFTSTPDTSRLKVSTSYSMNTWIPPVLLSLKDKWPPSWAQSLCYAHLYCAFSPGLHISIRSLQKLCLSIQTSRLTVKRHKKCPSKIHFQEQDEPARLSLQNLEINHISYVNEEAKCQLE